MYNIVTYINESKVPQREKDHLVRLANTFTSEEDQRRIRQMVKDYERDLTILTPNMKKALDQKVQQIKHTIIIEAQNHAKKADEEELASLDKTLENL